MLRIFSLDAKGVVEFLIEFILNQLKFKQDKQGQLIEDLRVAVRERLEEVK